MNVVVYDANVLYPDILRDVLIRVGIEELAAPRWSEDILDEMCSALRRERPRIPADRIARLRRLMCADRDEWLVTGHEHRIPGIHLPDPRDRHVVAAARQCAATAIVTFNRRDFPEGAPGMGALQVWSPDTFLTGLVAGHRDTVLRILDQVAAVRARPPMTRTDILLALRRSGVTISAAG